jgi:hypothetical protein
VLFPRIITPLIHLKEIHLGVKLVRELHRVLADEAGDGGAPVAGAKDADFLGCHGFVLKSKGKIVNDKIQHNQN